MVMRPLSDVAAVVTTVWLLPTCGLLLADKSFRTAQSTASMVSQANVALLSCVLAVSMLIPASAQTTTGQVNLRACLVF